MTDRNLRSRAIPEVPLFMGRRTRTGSFPDTAEVINSDISREPGQDKASGPNTGPGEPKSQEDFFTRLSNLLNINAEK